MVSMGLVELKLYLQWIQSLLFPKQKFKAGDARKGYAIEHSDPRLRFALCSGSHSDALVHADSKFFLG